MGHYSKKDAISVVTKCALRFKNELDGKNLLFVCNDKTDRLSLIEFTFKSMNFLHMTGLVPDRNITAKEFYRKCVDHKLSERDFEFPENGTAELKLDVLPYVISKDLSARMIGDLGSLHPKLHTEKLAGSVRACVGFVHTGNGRYVPNTVLKTDIRDNVDKPSRVVAVLRKGIEHRAYREVTYKVRDFDFSSSKWPDEYGYVPRLLESDRQQTDKSVI